MNFDNYHYEDMPSGSFLADHQGDTSSGTVSNQSANDCITNEVCSYCQWAYCPAILFGADCPESWKSGDLLLLPNEDEMPTADGDNSLVAMKNEVPNFDFHPKVANNHSPSEVLTFNSDTAYVKEEPEYAAESPDETEQTKSGPKRKFPTEDYTMPSKKKSGARTASRWSEPEDVILSGIVLEIYLLRHSLKPTAAEKAAAHDQGLPVDTIIWNRIHNQYEVARERYEKLTKKSLQPRTLRSLQKRWKTKGLNEMVETEEYGVIPLSKHYFKLWDLEYNRDGILTCDEDVFLSMSRTSQVDGNRTC